MGLVRLLLILEDHVVHVVDGLLHIQQLEALVLAREIVVLELSRLNLYMQRARSDTFAKDHDDRYERDWKSYSLPLFELAQILSELLVFLFFASF